MRALLAVGALTIAATVAACTSVATGTDTRKNAGVQPARAGEGRNTSVPPTVPAGIGPPSVVTATCTDRGSDAASLQRAINSSAPGAVIEIRGVCLLTRGIIFLANRTYTGYNTTGTVLKQDGNMSYVLASQAYADNSSWTGEPVTIRDLTVECNGSGGTNGIIVLNWQADVEEVDVSGCGGSGIVDTNSTADGRAIKNSSVNSRFDNNFISNSGRYGFEIYDSGNSVTDGFLDDNLIARSGLDGIHLGNAAGWDVSGNHLYGNARNGIYADRLYGTTISNNYIENFGYRQSSGTWCGITATAQGGIGSTIFNNKIFNDLGESTGANYIYLRITRTNYGTGYLSVTGNVIVGDKSSDVGLAFNGGSNELIVVSSGNEVVHVGTVNRDTRSATVTAGT
jgi:parallel beta-helix repeat protein